MKIEILLPTDISLNLACAEINAILATDKVRHSVELVASETRFIETAILIALIKGGSSIAVALISAIGAVMAKRGKRHLIIKGRHGGEIIIPTDADPVTIQRLTRDIDKLQNPTITVIT